MTNNNDFELFQTYIFDYQSQHGLDGIDIVFEHSNRQTNISCYMECAYLEIDDVVTVIFTKNWQLPVTEENINACAEDVILTLKEQKHE